MVFIKSKLHELKKKYLYLMIVQFFVLIYDIGTGMPEQRM